MRSGFSISRRYRPERQLHRFPNASSLADRESRLGGLYHEGIMTTELADPRLVIADMRGRLIEARRFL